MFQCCQHRHRKVFTKRDKMNVTVSRSLQLKIIFISVKTLQMLLTCKDRATLPFQGVRDEQRIRSTLVRSRTNNSDAPRLTEVNDEQRRISLQAWGQGRTDEQHYRYSLGAECGREMASNATGRIPGWHVRFGLVGAAAMCELHVIQGPNYAWSA